MNNRERFLAVMHYRDYDHLPVIHFGYWSELLRKWAAEGHISQEEADAWGDGNDACRSISGKLGFDFGFETFYGGQNYLMPYFKEEIVARFPDGSYHIRDAFGVTNLEIPGALSIRSEVEHLLVDRASWEKHYLPRLQWSTDRLSATLEADAAEFNATTTHPARIHLGSVIGMIRNIVGIVGLSYMEADDPDLLREIIAVFADISCRNAETLLKAGFRPDGAHYWEDICYNHGPLITPEFFRKNLTEHYRKMSALLQSYGCGLLSIDCDGKVDELLPLWKESGVNIVFPIELGTWNPDFLQWRALYGKELRGIGGVNKHVFSQDRTAVDREIERVRPWIEAGGFLPCPDHRLPPETQWDLVRYYTDRMHELF